jgi:hypothetical protein
MKFRFLFFLLFLTVSAPIQAQFSGGNGKGEYRAGINGSTLNDDIIQISGSSGSDGFYHSFSNASGAFYALNAKSQDGKTISVFIWGSANSETGTYSLNSGSWTAITIYPRVSGLTVRGNAAGPLIILDGASNVTIDGRLNAVGSVKDLSIKNIRYMNFAVNNILKYCTLTGDLSLSVSSTTTASGVVTVGGNVTVGNGCLLMNEASGNLTVTGNLSLIP